MIAALVFAWVTVQDPTFSFSWGLARELKRSRVDGISDQAGTLPFHTLTIGSVRMWVDYDLDQSTEVDQPPSLKAIRLQASYLTRIPVLTLPRGELFDPSRKTLPRKVSVRVDGSIFYEATFDLTQPISIVEAAKRLRQYLADFEMVTGRITPARPTAPIRPIDESRRVTSLSWADTEMLCTAWNWVRTRSALGADSWSVVAMVNGKELELSPVTGSDGKQIRLTRLNGNALTIDLSVGLSLREIKARVLAFAAQLDPCP